MVNLFSLVHITTLLMACVLSSFGLWLLLQKLIQILGHQIDVEKRIKNRMREQKDQQLDQDHIQPWFKTILTKLDYMLQSTKSNYRPIITLQNFFVFHFSLFLFILIVFFQWTGSIGFSIFMAVFIVISNYLKHVVRLRTIRLKNGYDLAIFTGLLASKYSSSLNPNMRIALTLTNQELHIPLFKKHLSNLIRTELNYKYESQLLEAVDRFVFPINTTFAKELGAIIFKALISKQNVGNTLVRLDQKIHNNIEDINKETESRSEIRTVSWLHVVAFPALFLIIMQLTNFSKTSMLQIQFNTTAGQIGFGLSVLLILVARVFSIWYTKQPNDY